MIAVSFIGGIKLGIEVLWDVHNMIVIDLFVIRVFLGSRRSIRDTDPDELD